MKRKEFEHEKEVRIVKMLDSEHTQEKVQLLQFPIPVDLIDAFCIDPRASSNVVAKLKNQLMSVGIPENRIIQSRLYQFNSHKMIFD